jgi:glycosyltransferase involved in cell wall biosynthesis
MIKISVVIATYNGEKFIREQIDSILAQTYPVHEIIIQDDRSTDNTWNILQEYENKFKNIKAYQNKINLGVNQNFISAFFKASGSYIATSDQDDVWKSEKLKFYVSEIEKAETCIIFSDSYMCNERMEILKKIRFQEKNIYDIIWRSMIAGHSLMFKKDLLLDLKNLGDIDFTYEWLINICGRARGKSKKIDIPLTYWRRHDSTITNYSHNPPEVKYRKPIRLTLCVLLMLFKKNEYENFKWQFDNIYKILLNYRQLIKIKRLLMFLYFYKKETLPGIIISSFIYFLIRNDLSLKKRLKAFYIPFYKYYFYKRDGDGLRGIKVQS